MHDVVLFRREREGEREERKAQWRDDDELEERWVMRAKGEAQVAGEK